jgi:hypothetical protein
MSSPLDKVLQLAQDKGIVPEAPGEDRVRLLVQAARVALTGACGTDNPVEAAELVYMASAQVESLAKMLATDTMPMELVSVTLTGQPLEDETIGLSVLTARGRKQAKTDGYTIAGSDDYPIPDKAHLSAAVGRYKQGAFAGHPAGTVKAHILKHARRLGVEVELVAPAALSRLHDGEVCLSAPPKGKSGGKGDDKDDGKGGPADHFHTTHSGGKHSTHYTADGGHHDHEDDDPKNVDDHFSKYRGQFGKKKR